jgi:hypothetical protein
METTQVNDSGHRIPRDPAGKHRKSLEHGSSIPTGNCPVDSCQLPFFPAGTDWKLSEKIRKISGRNTASTKSPELPGAGSFRARLFDLGIEEQLKVSHDESTFKKIFAKRILIEIGKRLCSN